MFIEIFVRAAVCDGQKNDDPFYLQAFNTGFIEWITNTDGKAFIETRDDVFEAKCSYTEIMELVNRVI